MEIGSLKEKPVGNSSLSEIIAKKKKSCLEMDMKGSVAPKSQMLDTVEEVAQLVENRGISQVEINVLRERDWRDS